MQQHIKGSTRQWQTPIGLQLVPGGFIGLGMLLVKESARWLAKKGRNEEALQTLICVRGGDTPEVRAEFDEILAGFQEEIRAIERVTSSCKSIPGLRGNHHATRGAADS